MADNEQRSSSKHKRHHDKDKDGEDSTGPAKPSVPPDDPSTHPGGLPPQHPSRPQTPDYTLSDPSSGRTLHLGAAQPLPALMSPDGVRSQRLEMTTAQGERLARSCLRPKYRRL